MEDWSEMQVLACREGLSQREIETSVPFFSNFKDCGLLFGVEVTRSDIAEYPVFPEPSLRFVTERCHAENNDKDFELGTS